MSAAGDSFEKFLDIVKRLRAPDGCPWDREQTPRTLRGDLIEETYECVEAIDEGKPGHIREELGDIFLLACMISYMHEQQELFSVADVLDGISEKLVRRHPHVFGGEKVKDSAEVLINWARIKVEQEGRAAKDSILDEVSRSLPPLDRAYKLQKKAAKRGFDWENAGDVADKVQEELDEVRGALRAVQELDNEDSRRELEEELGDLLFSAVNLCRFLKADPSTALAAANTKFTRRFKHVENRMKADKLPFDKSRLADMERFWQEAKKEEASAAIPNSKINHEYEPH
jgi:tetrapyrrole methylase family protein/MazG family protein